MSESKIALITGITGQIGSYLAESLLNNGYEVHGIIRRTSDFNTRRIDHIFNNLILYYGDLCDGNSLTNIVNRCKPDYVFNLGCQSHVKVSFDQPIYTTDTVYMGTLRLLDAVKNYQDLSGKEIRFYHASSSEQFGSSPPLQNEDTLFRPVSPYAVAKTASHYLCQNYRTAYNMFVSCGILFNTESPRRGPTFVTRKITRAIANIISDKQEYVLLGNLDAKRDWGYAVEYVDGIIKIINHTTPDNYVIATGDTHTIRQFAEVAFSTVGLDWQKHVRIDPRYYRPNEVDVLQGDASKARNILGWYPKVKFVDLVKCMVKADLDDVGLNSSDIMKDIK